jgi:uncharacterized protein YyaL (SSP411 family)
MRSATRPLATRLVLLLLVLCCACRQTNGQQKATATADDSSVEMLLYGDDAFKKKLQDALAAKGASYVPRTKHKDGNKPKYTNRLILETSPYLAQHAHNPVNWFPWGDEAFKLAHRLGRPVFLSIGYSTCHWCHVMEEESFEDEEIARYISEHYIPIKVDREERPDVDAIYMKSVQILTRRGGWPMSVWLTPERKPFYGGTYFPARDGDRGTRKGFLTLLTEQFDTFKKDPASVANDAERLAAQIARDMAPPASTGLPGPATVTRSAELASRRYDPVNGGPTGRPKFPSSFPIRLLLRYGQRAEHQPSIDMALATLSKMQAGGMYDHVAGGFHRYSTDERWLVPHFEKMLYDNALLATAYLDGLQVSGDKDMERVAREILDYVIREMTSPEGPYYSATDADSIGPKGEREEGYYFTWTPAELNKLLGAERAKIIMAYYTVTPRGNFEHGRTILNTPKTREEVAKQLSLSVDELNEHIAQARALMLTERNKRPLPIRDDKIQVSWNGLMIAAMARAARVLGDEKYAKSAVRAAQFLLNTLVKDGRLQHSYMDGRTTTSAYAEDYAFFAGGLIDLFEATQSPHWLQNAVTMVEQLEKYHANTATGGYYRSANDAEKLLAREMESRDGAVPSAGSWALMDQLRLWTLTTDDKWRLRAEMTMRGYAGVLDSRPWALDEMMLAVDFYTDSPKEIVVVLPDGTTPADDGARQLFDVMRASFVPNHVFVVAKQDKAALKDLVPWAIDKPPKKELPTAYVCERGACDLPTNDPEVFKKQITKLVPYPMVGGTPR